YDDWLGGYQDLNSAFYFEPDGGWKWITDETWSYTNWDTDQPDNGDNDSHILVWGSNAGEWHDANGGETRTAYVIEYESVPDGSITLTTDDQGYSGTGGALSDSDTITLEFNLVPPFADSPTWTTTPAALDTTFDGDGKQVLSLSEGVDYIHEMLQLDNGRILAAGAVDDRFAVLRFNSDLTLDSSFGDAGLQQIDFGAGRHALTLTLDKDDRILVGGTERLVRLTVDGDLDTTFDSDGIVVNTYITTINDVEVQADGKIVVTGSNNLFIPFSRYFADGTLDIQNQWDILGSNQDRGRGVVLRDDGDILLAGTAIFCGGDCSGFGLVRWHQNGNYAQDLLSNLDDPEDVHSILPLADGKLLLIGTGNSDLRITRHLYDGSIDTTFADNGAIDLPILNSTDHGYRATLQPDGKILIAGYAYNGVDEDIVVVRLSYDGVPDTTFDGDGKAHYQLGDATTDYGYAILSRPDGRILVAGRTGDDIVLMQLMGDSNQDAAPVNVAPVNSVPTSAQQVTANLPFAFTDYRENLVSISDADAGENMLEVTLSATHGLLTMMVPDPNGGLTYSTGDGFEDTTLAFTGTISDINEALSWLTYTPTVIAGTNGHGYGVIHTDAMTWEDAKADAESRGGHLATITSAEELEVISSLTPYDDWLGGYQDLNSAFYFEPDGGWKWITDETWSYTNWDTDQPDNGDND
ncbi:MAG: lectin-like protein, partial [Pirellulaceae bacterium]